MQKVFFTIFAGRERYLNILKKYLDVLLEKNLINEVHLWDFTRDINDEKYIKELCNNNSKYIYKLPETKKNWNGYYSYYCNVDDDTVVIKCDDDVIYIDINNFENFTNSIIENCLYFPHIVNNDVCAYFSQKLGVHNLFNYNIDQNKINGVGDTNPLTRWRGGWYADFSKADKIHELFLNDYNKFHFKNQYLIHYGNRISINFFAGKGNTIRRYFSEFMDSKYKNDDEAYISGLTPKVFNKKNIINMNFTVVHFQFGPQNGKLLDSKYIHKYDELANKLLT
jgi:hypothetical protein